MASEVNNDAIAEEIGKGTAGPNNYVTITGGGVSATFTAAEVVELFAERDTLAAHADRLALDVSDQSKRARAAEAVVEQVQALVDTWRKMAGPPEERADDAATMLRRVVASLSDVLPAGPTPLVCGCGIAPDGAPGWGGGCSPGCMEPAPTAGLDFRVMPPEIPLSAIPGMEDGDAATVTGTVSHRQVWPNAARADRAVVSLTDANTPAHVAYPIRVSPAGWEQYGGYLALGARVTCAIGASGENAWLTAAIPAGALDWAAEDESGWAGRKADDFPQSAYVPEQRGA